ASSDGVSGRGGTTRLTATPMPAPTTSRPAKATVYSTFSAPPRTSTNSAEVTTQVPISPNRRHPAHRSATATTTAISTTTGTARAPTTRASTAPSSTAPTAWAESFTERTAVLDTATTAPSGA